MARRKCFQYENFFIAARVLNAAGEIVANGNSTVTEHSISITADDPWGHRA